MYELSSLVNALLTSWISDAGGAAKAATMQSAKTMRNFMLTVGLD